MPHRQNAVIFYRTSAVEYLFGSGITAVAKTNSKGEVSDIHVAVVLSKSIEHLLRQEFRATGSGLIELATSIQDSITSTAFKNIQEIARERNFVVHGTTDDLTDRTAFIECAQATTNELRRILFLQQSSEPFMYCAGCKEQLAKQHFFIHARTHHRNTLLRCTLCAKQYIGKYLWWHFYVAHRDALADSKGLLLCPHCEGRRENIFEHFKTSHADTWIPCYCDQAFYGRRWSKHKETDQHRKAALPK